MARKPLTKKQKSTSSAETAVGLGALTGTPEMAGNAKSTIFTFPKLLYWMNRAPVTLPCLLCGGNDAPAAAPCWILAFNTLESARSCWATIATLYKNFP